jgi:multidrug resistance protein MdtO
LKYRFQLPGFELPQAVRLAQLEFDNRLAQALDGMADRMEGKAPESRPNLKDSFESVEQAIQACGTEKPEEEAALNAFSALAGRIESLTSALDEEI